MQCCSRALTDQLLFLYHLKKNLLRIILQEMEIIDKQRFKRFKPLISCN